jgi:hypothetical protein
MFAYFKGTVRLVAWLNVYVPDIKKNVHMRREKWSHNSEKTVVKYKKNVT